MTARSEALILLAQAQRLPIGSTGRTDLIAQATAFAVLAITEPRPAPEPEEPEPTPKEVVAQAVAKRKSTTKKTVEETN